MPNRNPNGKRSPKRKNKLPKRKPNRAPRYKMPSRLQMCTQHYARALVNPFDPEIAGQVCYPSFPSKRSMKYTSSINLTATVGIAGVGWVIWDPCPVTDANSVYYTDANYAGNTNSFFALAGTGISAIAMTSPVTSNSLSRNTQSIFANQARIVASGIKHRYTGTELNRGGSTYFIVQPNQATLVDTSLGMTQSQATSREMEVSSRAKVNVLPPAHEEDMEWGDFDNIFPWSERGVDSTSARPFAGLVFYGTPGNTYRVHIITHCEVAGATYSRIATPSHIGNQQEVETLATASASATYGTQAPDLSYQEQFMSALREMADSPVTARVSDFVARTTAAYLRGSGAPDYGGGGLRMVPV